MNYISEISALKGSKWYIACLSYVKFNLFVLVIWGEASVKLKEHYHNSKKAVLGNRHSPKNNNNINIGF